MKRVVRVGLLMLLAVVLMGVFYIAVVMGQPPEDTSGGTQSRTLQALPEPLTGPVVIAGEAELAALAKVFPAPVMFAGGASAKLTFAGGVCEDVPFEGGVARVVTLTYRTESFDTLTVQSIYPARALSLLGKDGRTFTGVIHDKMAGYDYVAMEDAATYRLHAQGEEALYVFTVPRIDVAALDRWTNALQLYRAEEK
ncbi:MAG: hypothetical protein IKK57_10340 [Clostridia bacterium]|nr:hypothetical protein [Clostridia bacterium]